MMIVKVQPGQTISLGIVEYLVVRNPGEQSTSFELMTAVGPVVTVAPESERTFPTASGGQQVALKNLGPDVLLVEPIQPSS